MDFSNDYFKTEVREGFEIPSMLKRAWAATMEVLEVIDSVCKANNIRYFAAYGTLLGAIRHKGFIPWDDDIDLFMLRETYERFIKISKQALPAGFVLAGMYSNSDRLQRACYVPQARVIADETLWNFNEYMKKFHGFPYQRIGIDIFPLDKFSENPDTVKLQKLLIPEIVKVLRDWDKLEKAGLLEKRIANIETMSGVKVPRDGTATNFLWRLEDAIVSLAHKENTELCSDIFHYAVGYENRKFPIKSFEQSIELEFEGFKLPVPAGYEEVLTNIYGDYKKPVRNAAGHDFPFYAHMEAELIKQIKATGFTGSVEEFCDAVANGRLRV